jgi:hypothetical protein
MTDQTTNTEETPNDDEEYGVGGAYDLAFHMEDRCRGFAYLLENTAEHVGFIDGKDVEGIARLAKDIAEKAVELFDRVRLEGMEAIEAKKEA